MDQIGGRFLTLLNGGHSKLTQCTADNSDLSIQLNLLNFYFLAFYLIAVKRQVK